MNKEKNEDVKPKKWTTKEKLRVLVAAQELQGEELGAFLRQEGLHELQLKEWQASANGALEGGESSTSLTFTQRRELAESKKRVKELERELRRKEKALAEAAALLILEKNWRARRALTWWTRSCGHGMAAA